jgi:hypothetical protein
LAAHLAGTIDDPGPTWHALRNVVFASGCRIEMCRSRSFQEAAKHAWGYFENALSVYARLLFFKTSITGVQVLTLMVRLLESLRVLLPTMLTASRHTTPEISERRAWNTCFPLMPSDSPMRKDFTGRYPRRKVCRCKINNREAASFGLCTVSRNKLHPRPAVHR